MNKSEKLKQIAEERRAQNDIIWAAHDRIKELNTQRVNITVSVGVGEVQEAEDNIEADQCH